MVYLLTLSNNFCIDTNSVDTYQTAHIGYVKHGIVLSSLSARA